MDECDGWVQTLHGQTLLFTGKVLVDGIRKDQPVCAAMAKDHGALTKPYFSRKVTLVVFADLASQSVTDMERGYSKKLVATAKERNRGHHICVVDAEGFSDLLDDWPAKCRELRPVTPSPDDVMVASQIGDGILGGPLVLRSVGQHSSEHLALDLSYLDEGTAAHEATVALLKAHLGRLGVIAEGHARGAPRFDAGWKRDGVVHIAEVKSLTGTSEDQQIRLGLGQVLDYVHQLELLRTHGEIQPVLALEKKPASKRWEGLFSSRRVLLTWAPEFPGC